jgi:hypothetical protein
MSRGKALDSVSWSSPSEVIRPGRKFSSTTSRRADQLQRRRMPSGELMSRHDALLVAVERAEEADAQARQLARLVAAGRLDLDDLAPRSARIIPQVGPMTMWVNSTTRTPSSGRPVEGVLLMMLRPRRPQKG